MAEHDDVELCAAGGDGDSGDEQAMQVEAGRMDDLQNDAACCRAQIAAARRQRSSLAAATATRCAERLASIEHQIRMLQPPQQRLAELLQSERDLFETLAGANLKTAAALAECQEAWRVHGRCQLEQVKAKDDVADIKALVARAMSAQGERGPQGLEAQVESSEGGTVTAAAAQAEDVEEGLPDGWTAHVDYTLIARRTSTMRPPRIRSGRNPH